MADAIPGYQQGEPASEELGPLIAEFKEETAGVPRAVGLALGSAGVLLLTAKMLFDLHPFFAVLGIFWIGLGFLMAGLARGLKKNRLLVYAEGLLQIKKDDAQACLWRDVQNILVSERREYASGLGYAVHYDCSLQHHDGAATNVDAVTMKPHILGLIRERWQMSTEATP